MGVCVCVWQWLKGLRAMWKDAEWRRNSYLPTVDEYMSNGHSAVVTDIMVQSAVYFIRAQISSKVINSAEFLKLSEIHGTIGRLLKDIVTSEVYRPSSSFLNTQLVIYCESWNLCDHILEGTSSR